MIDKFLRVLSKVLALQPRTLLKNMFFLLKYDYKKELRNAENQIMSIKLYCSLLKQELLYFKVIDYFKKYPNSKFNDEINYLNKISAIALFPYKQVKFLNEVACFFDSEKKMFYINHWGNKKLYFPRDWDESTVRYNYKSLIEEQCILGGGFYEKMPHQYLTDSFTVKKTDFLLDIGAAEGLFALELVDEVQKIYLFECDSTWFEALEATFQPYKEKVSIIKKAVGNSDYLDTIRIETCLKGETIESLFIKLDIEGQEISVLSDSLNFINKYKDVRIASCTYHNVSDSVIQEELFLNNQFQIEYSDGYMLYVHDENQAPPYFRNGLIRAKRS